MAEVTRRPLKRNSRLTQVAFGVIIAFLVAQVAWWLWFQDHYIGGVTAATEAAWQDDARLANRLARSDPGVVDEMLAAHPHLVFESGTFVVDVSRLESFVAEQNSALRMFRFEGVFFVLVVLTGLWILARSLAVARELERRQHNFLLAITHEFRTPISTLRLLIETLQYRRPTEEKVSDYLVRMEKELSRLERSSDQVLATARLEQVSTPGELQSVDVNRAVEAIVEKHRSGLETRGARISVEYVSAPLVAQVRPQALELVVTNLLDNAIKYSPGPKKPVRVAVERRGDEALLVVEDEGVGVDPTERGRIFERFYRPGSEMTRRSQGVGLGLYLVKTNVDLMQGRVSCEPRADGEPGARFVVSLPLELDSGRSVAGTAATVGRPAGGSA